MSHANTYLAVEDIKIGTKFKPVGKKNPRVHTVVDVLKTYNLAGKLVKTRFLAEHVFMGQTITTEEVATTIKRGYIPD